MRSFDHNEEVGSLKGQNVLESLARAVADSTGNVSSLITKMEMSSASRADAVGYLECADIFLALAGQPGSRVGSEAKGRHAVLVPLPDTQKELIHHVHDDAISLFDVTKLPPAEQDRIRHTQNLHEVLKIVLKESSYKDLGFKTDAERMAFSDKFKEECGIESGASMFKKLPEFGSVTKDGYSRLVQFWGTAKIPSLLGQFADLKINPPVGLELQISGGKETFSKSIEILMAQQAQRGSTLNIDCSGLQDIQKFYRTLDWMVDATKALQDKREDMLAGYLDAVLQHAMKYKDTCYHPGWAFEPEIGMDRKAWSRSFLQAQDVYQSASMMMLGLDQIRIKNRFESEAMKNLPPGIKILRGPDGEASGVDFAQYMLTDLKLGDVKNQEKLLKLVDWINQYKDEAQSAFAELSKDKTHVVGCCEVPLPHGWVDPVSHKLKVSEDKLSSPWKCVNLLRFDVETKDNYEGKNLAAITVTSKCSFRNVHPHGYLNSIYDQQDVVTESKTYKPNQFVAIQTSSGIYEMVRARDLEAWRLRQRAYMLLADAVTVGMDGCTVIGGGVAVATAKAGGKAVATELVKNAGKEFISTSYVLAAQRAVASRQIASGAAQIVLGGAGAGHNAGGEEQAAVSLLNKVRSLYFVSHAAVNLMPSGMKGAEALAKECATSSYGSSIAAGRLESARNMAAPFKQIDRAANNAMFAADKAFLGMVALDCIEKANKWGAKPGGLDELSKLADPKIARRTVARIASETTADYATAAFKDYIGASAKRPTAKVYFSPPDEQIISRAIALSQRDLNDGERKQFMVQLMDHLHYSETQIAELQKHRTTDNVEVLRAEGRLFDAQTRRVAAAALLLLSRQADGSYPDTIVGRTVNPPDFNDRAKTRQVEQVLTSQELISLLEGDFRRDSNDAQRLAKLPLLESLGVVSPYTAAAMLLDRVASADPAMTEQEKIKCLVQLGRILEGQKLDTLRIKKDSPEYQVMAAFSYGASQDDVIKRLTRLKNQASTAPVLRSTIDWMLGAINTEHRDREYYSRLVAVFAKASAGIPPEKLLDLRRQDMNAAGTDPPTLERKLIAARAILQSPAKDAHDKDSAIAALFAVSKAHEVGLSSRALQTLAASSDSAVSKHAVLAATLTLLNDMGGLRFSSVQEKNAAAFERVRLLELGAQLYEVVPDSGALIKEEFDLMLRSYLTGSNEPAEQVRVAAINAGQRLKFADNEMIKLLCDRLNPRLEPAPSVRDAVVGALKNLCTDTEFLRKSFDNYVRTEEDWLVRSNLEAFRIPEGNPKDISSETNKQYQTEAVANANKPAPDRVLAQEFLKSVGLRWDDEHTRNLFDYFDWNKEKTVGFAGSTTFKKSYLASIHGKNFSPGDAFNLEMELVAQNLAFAAYNRKLDALMAKGQRDEDGGKLMLTSMFELLTGASQMGKPFYQHNNNLNGPSTGEDKQNGEAIKFSAYTRNQEGLRNQSARQLNKDQGCNIQVFKEDPWNQVQRKICHEFRAICLDNRNGIDKAHLVELINCALTEPSTRIRLSDEKRALLVEGLNALCVRDDVMPELKLHILRQAAKNLETLKPETVKGKSGEEHFERTQLALIALLDRNLRLVNDSSAEYFQFRDALRTRSSEIVGLQSTGTPDTVKRVADEVLDRNYFSLITKFRGLPDAMILPHDRYKMLPQPDHFLLTEEHAAADLKSGDKELAMRNGTPPSRDVVVENVVKKILTAAKGGSVAFPEWKDTLLNLTGEKLDSRVRVASIYALMMTRTVPPERLREPLLQIYLSPKTHETNDPRTRALRSDVFALLSAIPASPLHESRLHALKADVIAKMSSRTQKPKAELELMDADKLCLLAAECVRQELESGSTERKTQARQLADGLRAYGDGLTLSAMQQSKCHWRSSGSPVQTSRAALATRGFSVESLRTTFRGNGFCPENFERYDTDFDKIVENLKQMNGADIPGALRAINTHAESLINAGRPSGATEQSDWMNTIIAINIVSRRLAASYYSDGSIELAAHHASLALLYRQLGSKAEGILYGGESMWRTIGSASSKMHMAAADQYKKAGIRMNDPKKFERSVRVNIDAAIDVELIALEKNKHKDAGASARLTEHLDVYFDKNSCKYACFMARKTWFDLQHATTDQNKAIEAAKLWHLSVLEKTAQSPILASLHRDWFKRTEYLFDKYSPQTKQQELINGMSLPGEPLRKP